MGLKHKKYVKEIARRRRGNYQINSFPAIPGFPPCTGKQLFLFFSENLYRNMPDQIHPVHRLLGRNL